MSEEAKKAERQRELEEKKARLEAYRQKRRVEKTLPSGAASSGGGGVNAQLAGILGDGDVLAAVLKGESVVKEEVISESSSSASVATTASNTTSSNTTTTTTPSASNTTPSASNTVSHVVELEYRRGAAVQESAPRVLESYVRTTQTDATHMDNEDSKKEDEVINTVTSSSSSSSSDVVVVKDDLKVDHVVVVKVVGASDRARVEVGEGLAQLIRAGEVSERWLKRSEEGWDALRNLRDPKGKSSSSSSSSSSGGVGGSGSLDVDVGGGFGQAEEVARLASFSEQRPVLQLSQSPHAPEVILSCFGETGGHEGGLALLWALDGSLDRPVCSLRCDARLTHCVPSPWHGNIVVGSQYGGCVCIWDTRAPHSDPVLQSDAGHSHPVASLHCVGTSHAPTVHTISTDGRQCSWSLDMMSRPQHVSELKFSLQGQQHPVAPTCASFALHETDAFVLGTEQGALMTARRSSNDPDLAQQPHLAKAHSGPVRSVAHRVSGVGVSAQSSLVASVGSDWNVRLWSMESQQSIQLSLPSRSPCQQVMWWRDNCSSITACDAKGQLHHWDVARDTRRPQYSQQVSQHALMAMAQGTSPVLSVGDAQGTIFLLKPSPSILSSQQHDQDAATVARLFGL